MSKKALHEVNRYPDPAFPVELFQVTQGGILPTGRGAGDFHWHEELQFTLLTAGEGVMQVNAQDYPLRAGQAIFLGSGRRWGCWDRWWNGSRGATCWGRSTPSR